MHCHAFVEHGIELEGRRLELPEDRIAGITDALESRLGRKAVEDRPGLGIDVAIATYESGGLR